MSTDTQIASLEGTVVALTSVMSGVQAQLKQVTDAIKSLTPSTKTATPEKTKQPSTGAGKKTTKTKAAKTETSDVAEKSAGDEPTKEQLISSLLALTEAGIREKGLALIGSLTPPCKTVNDIPTGQYPFVIAEATRLLDEHKAAA